MSNELKVKPIVFANPPIVEVVCGIAFEPLKRLLAPHVGLLWESYRSAYPECREVVPLAVQIESPDGTLMEGDLSEIPPLPRIQFLSEVGDGMVQIQRERFHYNWQKREGGEYPRFESVFSCFKKRLETFQEFLANLKLGELAPRQYELTYVNHVAIGEGWDSNSDIGAVFPDLTWRKREGRLEPELVAWRCSFWLPDGVGRLHAAIRTATRTMDDRRVLALELTARGMIGGSDMGGLHDWFTRAHSHVVGAFEDLSSQELQDKLWGRVR